MFKQDKPFWIARVVGGGDIDIVVKKTNAAEFAAFIERARKFNPYRKGEKKKLAAFYELKYEPKDLSAVKRIINRGTDGYVGCHLSNFGTMFSGGYVVSFTSSKAARLVAENLLADLREKRGEREAEERSKVEEQVKYTNKHIDDKRKVWLSSFLADRYDWGSRYDVQLTVGDIAKAERAFILDENTNDSSQVFDLMMSIAVDNTSPLKKVLQVLKGKTVAIMTEEGYHVLSTNKADAAKKRDKQLIKEALCDW